MDFKKGDKVKILEPYADMYGRVGEIRDVFESKWNTDITVEFVLTRQEASEKYPNTIYAEGINNMIMTELYQPFQLLRIPPTRLGRLLYV